MGSRTAGGLAEEEEGDGEEELVDCAGEGALVGDTDEVAPSAAAGEEVLSDRFRDLGVSGGLVGSRTGAGLAVEEAGDKEEELVGCAGERALLDILSALGRRTTTPAQSLPTTGGSTSWFPPSSSSISL